MLTVKFYAQPIPLKCYSDIEGHPCDASLFSKDFLLELPLVFLYISCDMWQFYCHHPSSRHCCLVFRCLQSFFHAAAWVTKKLTEIPSPVSSEPSSNFHHTWRYFLSTLISLHWPLHLRSCHCLHSWCSGAVHCFPTCQASSSSGPSSLCLALSSDLLSDLLPLFWTALVLQSPVIFSFFTWLYFSLGWSSTDVIYVFLLPFPLHKTHKHKDVSLLLIAVSPLLD